MRNWRLISLEGNKRETGRAAVASQPLTGKDVVLCCRVSQCGVSEPLSQRAAASERQLERTMGSASY